MPEALRVRKADTDLRSILTGLLHGAGEGFQFLLIVFCYPPSHSTGLPCERKRCTFANTWLWTAASAEADRRNEDIQTVICRLSAKCLQNRPARAFSG
jgi:hypothetical protein